MMEIAISTRRTRVRLVALADLDAIHKLHSLPETDKFNALGLPKDIEETVAIVKNWIEENNSIEKRNFTFVIESKLDGKFRGLFGLKLFAVKYRGGEVWYKILPAHWNKGLATEVLMGMIDFAFDKLGLHRIQAGCAVDNIGSIRVLEKVGMQQEGRRRQILPLKSGWSDNFEYSVLETDERKQSRSHIKQN